MEDHLLLVIFLTNFVHLAFYCIQNKAIETFTLACCKVFDDLTLALFDDKIYSVVGFLIISGSCFFLRI